MQSKWLNILALVALVLGMLPLAAPYAPVAAVGAEDGPRAQPVVPVSPDGRQPPSHLKEVPVEIQELFADGMPAEEFVAMAGYVPRALEGIVDSEAVMIIELEGKPLAVRYAEQKESDQLMTQATLDSQLQSLEAVQAQLEPQLTTLGVEIISNYAVVYNGFQAVVPLGRLNEIRALPGVKAVHRAPIHEPALSSSVDLIGAYDVWEDLGVDGDGVTIAIIDTGIDYTHAVFGGPGTPMAFDLNDPDLIEPNTFPTAKVIDGYDFAGTLYDAGCSAAEEAAGICTVIPQPDPDPLDERDHGTHVASIAAGVAAGEVMTGTAPGATLMALKVFGQSGSTYLSLNALEWATLQYLYTGKPEVINMSLGALYGPADPSDPDIVATDNAADAGIVVVAAAGNAEDTPYIHDAPGSADKAIAVAASEDGLSVVDGFEVITPADIAGVHPALQSVYYDWTSPELPVTGSLVYPADQPTGCDPFTITNTELISGNIVLLDWTEPSCGGSVARTGNAVAAGAIGVLIADDSPGFDLYIAGSDVVPAYSTPYEIGEILKAALLEGEVQVKMTAEYAGDVELFEEAFVDTIAAFSSRGPRGFDSYLKPDVTAPGGSIFAADMGTGTGGISFGGTSMATPHTAGLAALMKQAHPSWTPEQIKAAMMNTAVDLVSGFQIPRQGAGRIEAKKAINTPVVAIADEDLVSANWGFTVISEDEKALTKDVTLWNSDTAPHTFTVGAALQTGTVTETASITEAVTVEASDDTVVVPGNGMSATVGVTLTVDATQFPVGFWDLEEVYGFVTFQNQKVEGHRLRVPFYVIPRPYSKLDVIASNTSIANPAVDTVQATIQHSGPISSSLWAYPAMLQDPNEAAQLDPGDVRLLGMDYAGAYPGYGDLVSVAINSHGPWHTAQPYFAEFDLYLDVDEDGVDDLLNFNWNYGAATGRDPNDEWMVFQVDLATGVLYLASPFFIYTDYSATVMEWYLPAAWNGLGGGNTTFDYQLLGYDFLDVYMGTDGNPDVTAPGRFDYANSPFAWGITNDPGPADDEALGVVGIANVGGYVYSQPEGVMLVDYNGDPRSTDGGQVYFVPIEVTRGFVQVAHLAPFAEDTSVDIALNGLPILSDVDYGDSTGYVPVLPDEYVVEITPAGSSTVAISATVEVEAPGFYTAIAVGDGVNQDLELIALEDDLRPPAAGNAKVRLGHLAPFAAGDATADVRLQDGTPVLEGVNFGAVAGFLPLPAGEYDLKITTPGGGNTLIDPLPVTFDEGQILSAFAAGDGVNQDLGVFALPAGEEGFFLPLTVYTIYMPAVFLDS